MLPMSVIEELVGKMANNENYHAILREIFDLSMQIAKKQIIVKQRNLDKLQGMILASHTIIELETNLADNFNRPDIVLLSANKMSLLFDRLNKEFQFSNLSYEKRIELFKSVFEHTDSKAMFSMLFKKKLSSVRSTLDNCGGICNTVYYHSIETAAAGLMLAAGVAAIGGAFGGLAGMVLGALGIAGAVVGYFIAEDAAITALGDCFDARN